MFNRLPRTVTLTITLLLSLSSGILQLAIPLSATATQEGSGTWNSSMIWRPTLTEVGEALAEFVNQIDAACSVDVDPVVAANRMGPEGPVYAFAISWSCPTGTAQSGNAVWNSTMVWRATLPEAADGLAEVLNQIDESCSVDVDPVVASGGSGPEGPVYAFAITWSCAGLGMGIGPGPAAPQAVVTAVDIAFEPTQLTIPANTDTSLTVRNEGSATHNFTIDVLGISITLAPGEEANLTVNALPGTYEYYCNVPGHRDFGMTGTLTVA